MRVDTTSVPLRGALHHWATWEDARSDPLASTYLFIFHHFSLFLPFFSVWGWFCSFSTLLSPSRASSTLPFTLSNEDFYSSYSCWRCFSISVTPFLSSLSVLALLCGNTMISVLWYAELIEGEIAQNMTSNMSCWALLSLPSKLSLQNSPALEACGRCGHTLGTPEKMYPALPTLGVWQWHLFE